MQINRKTNDLLVEQFGEYVHLYAYIEEVETEDGVEWQGPLVVMRTCLDLEQLGECREALIGFAPARSTAEGALGFLDRTDYMVTKCVELGLNVAEKYPEAMALRKVAREIVRLEQAG